MITAGRRYVETIFRSKLLKGLIERRRRGREGMEIWRERSGGGD